MDFLRLYLGQITSLALVLLTIFAGAAIAARWFPNLTTIRIIRNVCIAAAVAVFALSVIPSLTLNQTPRGRVDRAAADQDQKDFEKRHSDKNK
jgi:hypothetical protein